MQRIYPKESIINQSPIPIGPDNTNYISIAVFRYISLMSAEKGEKISLAITKVNGIYQLFGQKITSSNTKNDKWRMIPQRYGQITNFYMYHCQTGLFLAKDDSSSQKDGNNLTLTHGTNLNNPNWFGVWSMRGDERGIYLNAPDLVRPDTNKSYCVTGDGKSLQVGATCDLTCNPTSPREDCGIVDKQNC